MNKLDYGVSMPFRRIINITDSLFVTVILSTLFLGLFIFLKYPPIVWVDLIMDDAYYYLGIVRNIIEHGASSFLPPFSTNGYQPLWLVVLTCFAAIFGTDEVSLVIQNYLVTCLFVLCFIALSRRCYAMAFPAIICSLSYAHITINGMESVMIPVYFILFMTSKSWQFRGCFGSLLFLSRLDALSVVIARDLYFVLTKRKTDFKHYLIIIPVILVYGLINYLLFGIPVPVSGLAKSIGNNFGENINAGLGYLLTLKTSFRLIIVILFVYIVRKQKIGELRYLDEISILLISCCFVAFYYSTKSGWGFWSWYYWAPFLLIYYALLETAFLLNKLIISKENNVKFVYLTLLTLGIVYTIKPSVDFISDRIIFFTNAPTISALDATFGRKNIELVELIKKYNIPENSFFAMGDRAGSFGYFLGNHYRFLHTEGLVGPTAYYQAMKTDNALDFIDTQNIDYWIAERENFLEANETIGVIEPIQGLSAHKGPYLICFQKQGIVFDQSYIPSKYTASQKYEYRYVFNMKNRVVCPDEFTIKLAELKRVYGGVRKFSLPIETQK
ncbi:hypothetical protein [Methylomonas sp. AM2-LC]|uniref:hypothetical protein n=1 Tax=Methylomonas sp. AM2-LC TaxID=3153301 RepID=UPI0032661BEF